MGMDIKEIMSIIPHRQPFLLIDRVEEIVEGEKVIATKKFKKKVVPGDVLRLEVSIEKLKRNAGIGVGTAYVGDKVAAQAEIIFMIG